MQPIAFDTWALYICIHFGRYFITYTIPILCSDSVSFHVIATVNKNSLFSLILRSRIRAPVSIQISVTPISSMKHSISWTVHVLNNCNKVRSSNTSHKTSSEDLFLRKTTYETKNCYGRMQRNARCGVL